MFYEANYDERKGVLSLRTLDYHNDVVMDNLLDQKDSSNGFSAGRTMRRVASVPTEVFYGWQREFERIGGKKQSNWTHDWRLFRDKKIAENPQFRNVDKLLHVTPNSGNIIIK